MTPRMRQMLLDWLIARLARLAAGEAAEPVRSERVVAPRVGGQHSRRDVGAMHGTPRQSNLNARPGQSISVVGGEALGDTNRQANPVMPKRGAAVPLPRVYPPFLPPPHCTAQPMWRHLRDESTTYWRPIINAAPWWTVDDADDPVIAEIPGLPDVVGPDALIHSPYQRETRSGDGGLERMETMSLKPPFGNYYRADDSAFEHHRNRLDLFTDYVRWYRYFPLPFMAGIDHGRRYVRVPDIPMFWLGERDTSPYDVAPYVFPGRNNADYVDQELYGDLSYLPNLCPEFWLVGNDGGDPPFPSGSALPADYSDHPNIPNLTAVNHSVVRVYEDDGTTEPSGQSVPGFSRAVDAGATPTVRLTVYDQGFLPSEPLSVNRLLWYRWERDGASGEDPTVLHEWAYNVYGVSAEQSSRSRVQQTATMYYLKADDGNVLPARTPNHSWQDINLAYLDDAVLYEGPYGTLPAPHSGRSGDIFCGITVDGSEFYSSEVLTALGGDYAIVVQESGAVTITRSDSGLNVWSQAWSGTIEQFFHDATPFHVWYPPMPTYAFLGEGDGWPQPTGHVWVRGAWIMLRERDDDRDRKFPALPPVPPIIPIYRDDKFEPLAFPSAF